MAYFLSCQRCGKETTVESIIDIIHNHTDIAGRHLCAHCGSSNIAVKALENAVNRSAKTAKTADTISQSEDGTVERQTRHKKMMEAVKKIEEAPQIPGKEVKENEIESIKEQLKQRFQAIQKARLAKGEQ